MAASTTRPPAKRAAKKPTPDPKVVAEKVASQERAKAEQARHDELLGITAAQRKDWPAVETDKAKRLAASKAEFATFKKWVAGGRKGTPPALPNYVHSVTVHANGGVEPKRARKASGGDGNRSRLGPRGQEGRAKAKAQNFRRGKGKRLTTDELVAYCARMQKQHPESSRNDEFHYAQWIEGIACQTYSFYAAWEAAEKGVTPVKATAVKKAPATKAPAKKATAARKPAAPKAAAKKVTAKRTRKAAA